MEKTNITNMQTVSTHLKKLGMPVNLSGYEYLKYGICEVVKDGGLMRGTVTRHLYPMIAKEYNTTASRAEKI